MATILNVLKNPAPAESSKKILRDALVEFVATSLFVFVGTIAGSSTGWEGFQEEKSVSTARILPIAMSFGLAILALAHSIGHLTGGHMNPGVTLMMFLRGQLGGFKLGAYWIAQFLGSLLGAAITLGCTSELAGETSDTGESFTLGSLASTTLSPDLSTGNGFLAEFMGSVVFYFVIAQTALDKRGIATTPFPALPIGLVLVAVHVGLIPLTGCGINPARTFGPSMVSCMRSSNLCDQVVQSSYWIYYIGPFLASLVVAELTNLMAWNPEVEASIHAVSSPGGGEEEGNKDSVSFHDAEPGHTSEDEVVPA